MLNTSVAAAFEGRAAVGMEGEEVSISAVPAATHLPLSVTSYYFDTNATCAVEYALHKRGGGAFISSFIQEMEDWLAITCR